jgi:integrase
MPWAANLQASADELIRLGDAMPAEYRPTVYLAGVLGLRWSEVAGLRVGRVDFLRGTLEVVETCAEVNGRVEFTNVKSRSSRRRLSVPPFVLAMLAEHLAISGVSEALARSRWKCLRADSLARTSSRVRRSSR